MTFAAIKYANVFQLSLNTGTKDASLVFYLLPPGVQPPSFDGGQLQLPAVGHVITSIDHLRSMYEIIGRLLDRVDGKAPEIDIRLTTWEPQGPAN